MSSSTYKYGKNVEFLDGLEILTGNIECGNIIINQSTPVGNPPVGKIFLFVDGAGLKYRNNLGTEVLFEEINGLNLTDTTPDVWLKFGNNVNNSGRLGNISTVISNNTPNFSSDIPTNYQDLSYEFLNYEDIIELNLENGMYFDNDFTVDSYFKINGGTSILPLYSFVLNDNVATTSFVLEFNQSINNFLLNGTVVPGAYNLDDNTWQKITHTYENSTGIHRFYGNNGVEFGNITENLNLEIGNQEIRKIVIGGNSTNITNFLVGKITSFKIFGKNLEMEEIENLRDEENFSLESGKIKDISRTLSYDGNINESKKIENDFNLPLPTINFESTFSYYGTTNAGDTNVLLTNNLGQNYLPPTLVSLDIEYDIIVRDTVNGDTNYYQIDLLGKVGFFNEDLEINSIMYDKNEEDPSWELEVSQNASGEIELSVLNSDAEHSLTFYGISKISAIKTVSEPFSGTLIGEFTISPSVPGLKNSYFILPFEGDNGIPIFNNISDFLINQTNNTAPYVSFSTVPQIRVSSVPKIQAIYLDGNYDVTFAVNMESFPGFSTGQIHLQFIKWDETLLGPTDTDITNLGSTLQSFVKPTISHNFTFSAGTNVYTSPVNNITLDPAYYLLFIVETVNFISPGSLTFYDITLTKI